LQEIRVTGDHARNVGKSHIPLATITYETVKYLENTPCVRQTPEIIAKYMKEVEKFNLTKLEKLLLINLRPTTAVEIQLIIQDSEERLTDEQVEELISITVEHLPEFIGE